MVTRKTGNPKLDRAKELLADSYELFQTISNTDAPVDHETNIKIQRTMDAIVEFMGGDE